MFSASRSCVQILATWGRALSCFNMRWWSWMNGATMGLRISSQYLCAFKIPSINCTCVHCPWHTSEHTITPPLSWATWSTTSANGSPTQCHTRCLPSALNSENRDSSVKRTPLQRARRHRMWAFARSSRLRWRTAVRVRPRWGQRACRWASLRQFLTVCAEIPIVAAAVRVAGSETPLETAYGREINIQLTGNSSGGHYCSQHANCTFPQNCTFAEWPFIVASLRYTCAIFMLSNQHFDMPHLLGGMDNLGKGEVLTNTDLDRFVNNIWEKWIFCVYRKKFRSLSSAHEKWEQKQEFCVYIFVQCT